MIKILFFIEGLRSGGKERRLIELLKYLKKREDYSIQLIVLENEIHFKEIYETNIPIHIINRKIIKKDPRPFYLFFKICRDFSPDILHLWGNMPAFYALPSSLLLNIPIINSQITESFYISHLSFYYIIQKINLAFSKYVSSNSKAGLEINNLIGKKYLVIHNGVSMSRFEIGNKLEELNGVNIKNKTIIVMVGSFTKNKNYDLFIELAKHYQEKLNDVTFIAVGDGENYNKIKNRVTIENINNVILTGAVNNVEEIVHSSDIGVLFSPYGEGLSNAILEYMALGKPVVASNKGGNSELIDHNETGFMVEEDCVERITFYLDKLIFDNELRSKMGKKGKTKIEKDFSIESMTAAFMKLYNQTIIVK